MSTIATVLAKTGGPYSQPLRVKVLARGEVVNYKGSDGSCRQSLPVAVTDGTSCCKLVCYDPSKFEKLKIEQCVVLREIIVKKEETPAYFVATRSTKIFMTGGVKSSPELSEECIKLVNPPPAPQTPLASALKSPVKQKISVRGKVVQEETMRTVLVKGEEVQLRTITLEDSSGRAKLTLWREAADVDAHPGDHVEVTDCVINVYKNETSLTTTGRSNVEKTDAPLEVKELKVEAVNVEGDIAELLTEDNDIVSVPAELLAQSLGEKPVETLTDNGPVSVTLTRRGSEVIEVKVQ